MMYEEFENKLFAQIREEYPGVSIEDHYVEKLNGQGYDGVHVQLPGESIGITLNTWDLYGQNMEGRPMDNILEAIRDGLAERMEIPTQILEDYGSIRDKLLLQVVETKTNQDMLKNIPHKEEQDMSVVYRIILDGDATGQHSAIITNEFMESLGITAEQLDADARASAREHFPASVRSMNEVLADLMGVPPEMMPKSQSDMYVATCNGGLMGAGCMFYPDFMEEAAKTVGGNFFVLPSSIHEVILVPEGVLSWDKLQDMVQQINVTEVSAEDKLSDTVYHYDAKEHIFEMADQYAERQATHDKTPSLSERLAEKQQSFKVRPHAHEPKEPER